MNQTERLKKELQTQLESLSTFKGLIDLLKCVQAETTKKWIFSTIEKHLKSKVANESKNETQVVNFFLIYIKNLLDDLKQLPQFESETKKWLFSSIKEHLKSTIENESDDIILSLHRNLSPIHIILPDVITQHIFTFIKTKKLFQLLRMSKDINQIIVNAINIDRNCFLIVENDIPTIAIRIDKYFYISWEDPVKFQQKYKLKILRLLGISTEKTLDLLCNSLCLKSIDKLEFFHWNVTCITKFLNCSSKQLDILPNIKYIDFSYLKSADPNCIACFHVCSFFLLAKLRYFFFPKRIIENTFCLI